MKTDVSLTAALLTSEKVLEMLSTNIVTFFAPDQNTLTHSAAQIAFFINVFVCVMNVKRDQFFGEQVETLDEIVLSDGCFKLSSYMNRHNCVYWADKNLYLSIETLLNLPGITVWGTLSSEGVIGPVFFFESVSGENCLEMLREVVVPQLHIKPNFHELFFQQDGAPPYLCVKNNRLS